MLKHLRHLPRDRSKYINIYGLRCQKLAWSPVDIELGFTGARGPASITVLELKTILKELIKYNKLKIPISKLKKQELISLRTMPAMCDSPCVPSNRSHNRSRQQ